MRSSPRGPRPSGQKAGELTIVLVVATAFSACRPTNAPSSTPPGQAAPAAPPGDAAPGTLAKPGPVATPTHGLSEAEAATYALALINRDRATQGLTAVSWDETAAKSASRHAKDMVLHGVTAHWGTDGSTPEIRYTDAGGSHLATENVGCLADAKPHALRGAPYEAASILEFEDRFFNEKPPADGHRKNILEPRHTRVGVGFAAVEGFPIVCVVHEFIDDYGTYAPLPRRAKQGEKLTIAGTLRAPATFGGIGIGFEPAPKPRSPEDLAKTGGYAMPAPFVSYFPQGYVTPLPVKTDGASFSLDLPAGREKGPGEYTITIFAQFPGQKKLVPVSMRTVAIP
jgi:uncharacterized protein YkwD